MSLLDDYPKVSSVTDLATYLGIPLDQLDMDRAWLVLALAETRCELLLKPLTVAALPVILDVAQRSYVNVTGASAQAAGSFSVALPSIGVSLTSANRRELRVLAGGGGAFTVDPTPAAANPAVGAFDYGMWSA